jgi:DNA-directed RNA polymerase specialized sigma24 family protein
MKHEKKELIRMDHHAPTELPLASLSTSQLKAQITLATQQYLRHLPADERYAMELFRRAIAERDEAAWIALYELYCPLVLTWVSQHQQAMHLLGQESGPQLVNAGFTKFAQALPPDKFPHFAGVAAILAYLKMCVRSVIADEVRTCNARPQETSLECMEQEPTIDNPAEAVIAKSTAQDLWLTIQSFLFNEQERVAIYLLYLLDMKPREVSQHRHDLFPTADDVYRVRRNVLERLRRNQGLQAMARQEFPHFSPSAALPQAQ